MSTITLAVQGMTCGGCENAVKRAVGAMPGVADVAASFSGQQVVITFDPDVVTTASLEAKIAQLGYTVQR